MKDRKKYIKLSDKLDNRFEDYHGLLIIVAK